MAGQHDSAGLGRRHHAEHGHNRTVKIRPFHKAASPSLGIWVVSRSNRGWVGVYFVRRQCVVFSGTWLSPSATRVAFVRDKSDDITAKLDG
jgi:hypothetical protein